MRILKAGFEIMRPQKLDDASRDAIYGAIEAAARTCYKSEDLICEGSAEKMCRQLIKRKHYAMLEHASLTVRFFVDRGVTHECVRHRVASFAQESTRYCNYNQYRFGNDITYVDVAHGMKTDPKVSKLSADLQQAIYQEWLDACADAEMHYMKMIDLGASPQIARSVLNNSTKSELVITMNIREWRHFLKLRALGTTGKPHPQMSEVAVPLLASLATHLPALFGDLLMDDQAPLDDME